MRQVNACILLCALSVPALAVASGASTTRKEVFVNAVEALVDGINNGEEVSCVKIGPGTDRLSDTQQLMPKKRVTILGAGTGRTIVAAIEELGPGRSDLPAHEVDDTKANSAAYLFHMEDASAVHLSGMALTAPKLHAAVFARRCTSPELTNLEIRNFIWSIVLTYDVTSFRLYDCRLHETGGTVKWMRAAIFSNKTTNGEFYNSLMTTQAGRNPDVTSNKFKNAGIRGFTRPHRPAGPRPSRLVS